MIFLICFFKDISRCSIRWTKMCEPVTGLVKIKFVSILTCFYSISIQHMTVCLYVKVSNRVWIPFKIVEMKMEIALFTCETWATNVIKWKKKKKKPGCVSMKENKGKRAHACFHWIRFMRKSYDAKTQNRKRKNWQMWKCHRNEIVFSASEK